MAEYQNTGSAPTYNPQDPNAPPPTGEAPNFDKWDIVTDGGVMHADSEKNSPRHQAPQNPSYNAPAATNNPNYNPLNPQYQQPAARNNPNYNPQNPQYQQPAAHNNPNYNPQNPQYQQPAQHHPTAMMPQHIPTQSPPSFPTVSQINGPGPAGDRNQNGIPDVYETNLPPGFQASKDPRTNKVYWIDHNTKRSQWQDPRPEHLIPMPPGWTKKKAPAHWKQNEFYEHTSGKNQFHKPRLTYGPAQQQMPMAGQQQQQRGMMVQQPMQQQQYQQYPGQPMQPQVILINQGPKCAYCQNPATNKCQYNWGKCGTMVCLAHTGSAYYDGRQYITCHTHNGCQECTIS